MGTASHFILIKIYIYINLNLCVLKIFFVFPTTSRSSKYLRYYSLVVVLIFQAIFRLYRFYLSHHDNNVPFSSQVWPMLQHDIFRLGEVRVSACCVSEWWWGCRYPQWCRRSILSEAVKGHGQNMGFGSGRHGYESSF